MSQIKIITKSPLCVNEPDYKIHQDENGELRNLKQNCSAGEDKSTDSSLIEEIVAPSFKENKLNCLDLGCAAGNFILDLSSREETGLCVGLDGSRGVYKHSTWHNESNKNILHHANLVEPFRVEHNGNLALFDIITCWEVIEHFREDQLDVFFNNVKRHLKPGGMFFGSIALFPDIRDINGFHEGQPQHDPTTEQFHLHKTVYSSPKSWDLILENYFTLGNYDFKVRLRNHHNSYYFCCAP